MATKIITRFVHRRVVLEALLEVVESSSRVFDDLPSVPHPDTDLRAWSFRKIRLKHESPVASALPWS